MTPELQGRLRWHCRRGMKELDVLLERWFDTRFETADAPRREAFRQLLDEPDPQIAEWLIGGARPDEAELAALIDDIVRSHH